MIKTILFDVDGVLLSEERYFDASALTVWELLNSHHYLGLSPGQFKTNYTDSEITAIRKQVFENDRVLKFLKSRGLNANWDMIYLTIGYQLIHLLSQVKDAEYPTITNWLQQEMDREVIMEIGQTLNQYDVEIQFDAFVKEFQKSEATKQALLGHLDILAKEKLGIETNVFGKKGALWSVCEHISQEWYVGDDHVLTSTGRPSVQIGKKGFLSEEKTLASAEDISDLFDFLTKDGISIGIGTGRPALETFEPFKYLNWLSFFHSNVIVTADDALAAEKELSLSKSLSKPHPFTYLMALAKKEASAKECVEANLPIANGNEVLIVGDSLADLLAARQMGCQFAAVLTGLSGKEARAEFEKHHADYILDDVLAVKELVQSLY